MIKEKDKGHIFLRKEIKYLSVNGLMIIPRQVSILRWKTQPLLKLNDKNILQIPISYPVSSKLD